MDAFQVNYSVDNNKNPNIASYTNQTEPSFLNYERNLSTTNDQNSTNFNNSSMDAQSVSEKEGLSDEAMTDLILKAVFASFQTERPSTSKHFNFLCKSRLNSTEKARVTLFTTVKITSEPNTVFYKTIEHWSKLRPFVQPVLFIMVNRAKHATAVSKFALSACKSGWDVTVSHDTDKYGHPYLKDMFLHSFETFSTHWHGFCNSDILLDQSFVKALMFFDSKMPRSDCKNILLAGRRHDIEVI